MAIKRDQSRKKGYCLFIQDTGAQKKKGNFHLNGANILYLI